MAEPSFAISASFRPTFTAGGTLRRGLAALFRRPFTYLGLTLAQAVPVAVSLALLYAVIGADGWTRVSTSGYPGWFLPIYIAACFAGLVPYAATLHVASEQLFGRRVSFGASLAVGARRLFPLLGVYLLFALIVTAGTVVFIVPGIILTTISIVSMPIAVQEQRGVLASLGRAARLSKGYRPTLFVIGLGYLGIAIAAYVGSLIILFVIAVVAAFADLDSTSLAYVGSLVAMAILCLAMMVLFPVLLAATYVGLREEKDGGAPEQVAGVFA